MDNGAINRAMTYVLIAYHPGPIREICFQVANFGILRYYDAFYEKIGCEFRRKDKDIAMISQHEATFKRCIVMSEDFV